MNQEREIIPHGSIAIKDGQIEAIGKTLDIKKNYHADLVINAEGKAVLPGFICTHTHLFQILLRSIADDMNLFDWCRVIYDGPAANLQPNDCYAAAMIGCAELIKSGVTTVVDNHTPFPRDGLDDAIMQAFLDIGIRGIEARGGMDIDEMSILDPSLLTTPEKNLSETKKYIERWHGKNNDRTRVMLGTGAPFACSPEFLKQSRQIADKYNVGIVIHLAETKNERDAYLESQGRTSIEYCEENGLLGPDLIGIHCVWLTDNDVELFKKYGCTISHNPASNMYLASGIAPISRYIKEKLTVSLGVDGAASNNSQDMLETMKLTALLQKVASLKPLSITANQVLEMATLGGAKAVGLENKIGSLEPNKYADIVIMNLRSVSFAPTNYVPSQIVYCGNSRDIDTVLVNGDIVLEKGQLTNANEDNVITAAQAASDRLIENAGLGNLRKHSWSV
ncbi:MAG: amidohydrolase family protein [Candidatus Ranarchaeia archaeon]